MYRRALETFFVTTLLMSVASGTHAQLRQDALVQAPELKRPARGTLGSALAGFELAASALARGSAALPSPFTAPTERGAPALGFFPAYLADQGISEWGMGWSASLSIRRFRPLGAIDYATDRFVSPWGALSLGDDDAFYVDGLEPRMRLELADGAWTALGPDGTRYTFRASDALTTPAGSYEWWISEALSSSGERTLYEYATGPGGRRYLTRVRYGGRAGVPQTEVRIEYEPLARPFVDRRSGITVPLDRRVTSAVVSMWDVASETYLERFRYELGYTQNPAAVAHYLTVVRRTFASGASEPETHYTYRFGEEDARAATAHEARALSSYLAHFGPGSLAPSKASYVDLDRDGRTDIEHAFDQELARHTDSGMVFEPLPRDGSELALCRPAAAVSNLPRSIVRWTPEQTEASVMRFVREAADTTVYRCDRQGHRLASASLPGDFRLGPNTRLADVDRDLRPDLLRLTRGRLEVKRNLSTSEISFGASTIYTLTPEIVPSRSWIVDLTGDGIADLVAVANSAFYVWAGFGTGAFESAAARLPLFTTSGGDIGSIEDSEVAFVDANRDGLSDVLLSRGPQLRLLTHRGNAMRQIEVPAFSGLSWDASYPITVDLEGVGEEQAVVSAGNVAYAISFTSPSAGLLVAADDGKGGSLALQYERAPATAGLTTRPPLLATMQVANAGTDTLDYRFDYERPVFHSQGEYLIGYRTVRRTTPSTIDETEFYHDDLQTALPLRTTEFDTLTSDLPQGLYRMSETQYEPANFRGLPYRRAIEQRSGIFASGAMLSASKTQTLRFSDDGLCPVQTRIENAAFQLTTTRTLAAPSQLTGALHCLFETEVEAARHAAAELDFTYTARVARTPIGQVERVELAAGDATWVAQVNRYDAQQRLVESGAPGRGATHISYHPVSGDVLSVTAPDGVRNIASEHQPNTAAITALLEDRGAAVPYETHIGYDGMERLRSYYDNLGEGSAALPDQRISYAFAGADRPASIVTSVLVDAASASYASESEWLTAAGVTIAQGTAIPEGWALNQVTRVTRALAQTDRFRRDPIASTDAHAVTLAQLYAPEHSHQLGRSVTSLFGHTPLAMDVLQAGTSRSLSQHVELVGGALLRTSYENGALFASERFDGDGRLIARSDAAGLGATFRYDALGRLVDVSLPNGVQQSRRFDGFGRARSVARSELGRLEFDYDPTSGLLAERRELDRAGVLIRSTRERYDSIGRRIERSHLNALDDSEQHYRFGYDGVMPDAATTTGQLGRLSVVQGPDFERRSVYRADGLPATTQLKLADHWRIDERYEYFEDGKLRRSLREVRNRDGALLSVLGRRVERDAFGRELRVWLIADGERPLYEVSYDNEGRIEQVAFGAETDGTARVWVAPHYDTETHTARGYLQLGPDWELAFDAELDARGLTRVEHISHRRGEHARTLHDRVYGYDARRFLRTMTSVDGNTQYTYDALGLPASVADSRGERMLLRSAEAIAAGDTHYRLDAAGRVIERGDLTFSYGANGQLARVQRGTTRYDFRYDDSDQRLLKLRDGVPVAAYLGDSLLTDDGLIEAVKIAGRVVGLIVNGVFQAVATDPRGSVLAAASGDWLPASPYGVRESHPALAAALDYAAKGYDADLGLVRMGTRDYDPYLGQFTTPDPLYREDLDKCSENPIACGLYGYANNDPVGFVDPSGLDPYKIGVCHKYPTAADLQKSLPIQPAVEFPKIREIMGDALWSKAVEAEAGLREMKWFLPYREALAEVTSSAVVKVEHGRLQITDILGKDKLSASTRKLLVGQEGFSVPHGIELMTTGIADEAMFGHGPPVLHMATMAGELVMELGRERLEKWWTQASSQERFDVTRDLARQMLAGDRLREWQKHEARFYKMLDESAKFHALEDKLSGKLPKITTVYAR